jgi:thiol:disulfide interchange protein DsbC
MNQTNFRKGPFWSALAFGLALFMVGQAGAAPTKENAEIEQVKAALIGVIGPKPIDSVAPSPVPGLYEVMIGATIFYVTADGKYLLNGNLIDVEKREDLTSAKEAGVKAKLIEDIGEENMVIFAPEKYQHTVTVFTDIDCGYCRKLHAEVGKYNDLGIRVRYLMFPRAGQGSPAYRKAVSVFCASDRNTAMTRAKAGQEIEMKDCENPVDQEYALGQELGVTGTPAIFLESGDLIPGYVPADRMAAILEKMDKQ